MIIYGQEELSRELCGLINKGSESVLLVGSKGIGKTHIMDVLSNSTSNSTLIEGVLLSAPTAPGESELILERKMTENKTLWLIDDIDLLAGKSVDFREPLRFNIKSYFMRKFYPPGVCIATCTEVKDLDDWVLSKFNHQIRIVVSQPEQRRLIVQELLTKYAPFPLRDLFVDLAIGKFGATPKDLDDILQRIAANKTEVDESMIRGWFDFCPQALLPYISDIPKYDLDALYGLEAQKAILRASLIEPIQHYQLYQKHGLSAPKGIVLHGPTGSGKTHLGIAMVRQAGLNLLFIDSTTLRSKYVGETEKRLQHVFQSARECAPCVLFFDRLECLMGERTEESTGAARLVSCFLTELDGIGTKSHGTGVCDLVIVMGTVERLDQLDPAIIRPGRLGVHVGLGELSRDAVLDMYKEYESKGYRLNNEDIQKFIEITKGYSGAKLRQLFRDAAYHALRLNKDFVDISDFNFCLNE